VNKDEFQKLSDSLPEGVSWGDPIQPWMVAALSASAPPVGVSRDDVLVEAARVASEACLVPPDGGSPTEAEVEMCDRAAARIRALKGAAPASKPDHTEQVLDMVPLMTLTSGAGIYAAPIGEASKVAELTDDQITEEIDRHWVTGDWGHASLDYVAFARACIAASKAMAVDTALVQELPQSVLDFDQFLNEPWKNEGYQGDILVREYRHEAYPKWTRAIDDMRKLVAALSYKGVEPKPHSDHLAGGKPEADTRFEDLVRESFRNSKLFRTFMDRNFWNAKFVNLQWRYNGEYVYEEADWIKDIWYALRGRYPGDPPPPEADAQGAQSGSQLPNTEEKP
jgi:hypothetical protein